LLGVTAGEISDVILELSKCYENAEGWYIQISCVINYNKTRDAESLFFVGLQQSNSGVRKFRTPDSLERKTPTPGQHHYSKVLNSHP